MFTLGDFRKLTADLSDTTPIGREGHFGGFVAAYGISVSDVRITEHGTPYSHVKDSDPKVVAILVEVSDLGEID